MCLERLGPIDGAGKSETLYKRLGGYDAIAAVVDDFFGRAANDKQLSRFLIGLSSDSKTKLRQLIVDQLCEATEGPFFIRAAVRKPHMQGWASRKAIGK